MTGGPIRILCLGNELVSDDGVGIRVGRVLAQLPLPAGVTVEFQLGIGLELMDSLRPAEELIIVDAAQTGAPPGTCHITELDVEANLYRYRAYLALYVSREETCQDDVIARSRPSPEASALLPNWVREVAAGAG